MISVFLVMVRFSLDVEIVVLEISDDRIVLLIYVILLNFLELVCFFIGVCNFFFLVNWDMKFYMVW